MNSTFEEWQDYINARKKQGFTAIQVFSMHDWAGQTDVYGNVPFFDGNLQKANPVYWQEYERRIQYINEQGMVVLVVGLMEPLSRYPSIEQVTPFARNQTARLMGNHVILSPSFDSWYGHTEILANAIGEVVREATSLHLMTQHPDTNLETPEAYYNRSYVDICGLQSGAGWVHETELIDGKEKRITIIDPDSAAAKALVWSQKLYERTDQKPLINLEARYDNDITQDQLPRLPRSCGYWSFLNGCCGYTYGCAGIWNWGVTGEDDPQASQWTWKDALICESAQDMTHMAKIFGNIAWWKLEPSSIGIQNQSQRWINKMVFAKTADNTLGVAYLPNNTSIELKDNALIHYTAFQWINPSTGELKEQQKVEPKSNHIFQKPSEWEDAVLVLTAF